VRLAGSGNAADDSEDCDTGRLGYDHTFVVILALDTTTRAGSVAVARDDEVLSLVPGDAARTHGERLPGEIDRALIDAGLSPRDLDLLVVASGPGAFTGLRIGLAAIQGLAMVIGAPVIGVSALDAVAETLWASFHPPGPSRLVVWMDAQRGEVFEGRYVASPADGTWVAECEPSVAPPDAALAPLGDDPSRPTLFSGDGADRYRGAIQAWSASAGLVETPRALAPALARIGRRGAARGLAGPPHALQPLYVRRPDAELERLRRASSA
jgi:tRNA threonylcarbamoyladenosine biosynthesis protein TsaB